MITNALIATRFVEERKGAGMPVATDEQLARAKQIVERNPQMRQHFNPLGLQQLALRIPLTRRERIVNRVLTEKPITLVPRRTRKDFMVVEAPAAMVEQVVSEMQGEPIEYVALSFCQQAGYADPSQMVKRVERFANQKDDRRLVNHIREKMYVLSAMAQAINLVQAQLAEAAAAAKTTETPADD